MIRMCCRVILTASALFAFASSAMAASFLLPDDAVIEIKEFVFPADSGVAPERNLPVEFHTLLEHAMRKSGFTISNAHEDGVQPTKRPETSESLRATPLQPETPVRNEREQQTGETTPAPGNGKDSNTDNDEEDYSGEEEPLAGEEAVRGIFAMPGEFEGTEIAPPAEPHENTAVTHILEGNITLFRETVGNPARLGGGIRIRTEALLHCMYKVRDAATGMVIISDTSSGSSARVVTQGQDIDAALATLSVKAMEAAAAKIAAGLSGKQPPAANPATDREYYQDSPGKRLKPGM